MNLVEHHDRGYGHAPGISPYSAGVRALDGHRIRRVTFRQPLPWRDGFAAIDRLLAAAERPPTALCSIELRCSTPHSFDGFGSFNDDYRDALASRGLLLGDGTNPVARTNVAPCLDAPTDTEMFAFGYTVPDPYPNAASDPDSESARPSFIVSGAGDLYDQSDLRPEAIVGGDTPWAESGVERTSVVLDEIESRLAGLGVGWADSDAVVVYSAEPLHHVMETVVLERLGSARHRGVHLYLARPPLSGLLYEMDARGGTEEVSE